MPQLTQTNQHCAQVTKNFRVKFLWADVISIIQPLDEGLFANVKSIYRSNLLQKLIKNII